MAKKTLEEVVAENRELGFDPEIIQIAYANVKGDSDKVIEEIFRLQEMFNQYPQYSPSDSRNPRTLKTRTRNSAKQSRCRSTRPRTKRSP